MKRTALTSIVINPKHIRTRPDSWKVYFTYADLQSFPEFPESPLLELVNGELYMVPSPIPNHQRISRNIEFIFVKYLEEHPVGEIFDAPIDVVFSEENVLVPDLVVILDSNKDIIKEKNISGSPDLIIEILSQNEEHDKTRKKELYARNGVREYWIVDIKEESITVHLLGKDAKKENSYKRGKMYAKTDFLSPSILPDLKIDLRNVFRL